LRNAIQYQSGGTDLPEELNRIVICAERLIGACGCRAMTEEFVSFRKLSSNDAPKIAAAISQLAGL
jgi:hypothetical protein